MKRFLKKHIGFVVAIGVSSIVVLFLLVMVFIQNNKRYEAAKQLNLQKDAIKRLNDSKPSPARENIEALENDTVKYREKLEHLHQFFGRPYERALKSFCESLGVPTEDFRALFRTSWEKGIEKNQRGDQIYALFIDSAGVLPDTPEDERKVLWTKESWKNAMSAFVEEAQKYTLEDIGGSDSISAKELLMASLGVPRSFGDNETRCKAYVDSVRASLIKKFAEGNVGLGDAAMNFSFVSSGDGKPSKEQMVSIGKVWDIICDLGGRIAQSDIGSLESFSVDNLTGTEGNGGFSYYRFQIEVSGTIEEIRQLTTVLADAYKDSRVYVVRRFSLMKDFDEAQILIEENINRSTAEMDGGTNGNVNMMGNMNMMMLNGSNTATTGRRSSLGTRRGNIEDIAKVDPNYIESKKFIDDLTNVPKEEEKTMPSLRRNYARPVIGVGKRCTASLVVDYVVYVTDDLVTE